MTAWATPRAREATPTADTAQQAVVFAAEIAAGETARVAALLRERPELAQAPIRDPAHPTRPHPEGLFPLHLTAQAGHADMALVLLAAGAAPNEANAAGYTPLHWAALNGQLSVALLLAYGAPVEARDGSGYTPLHLAAERGDDRVAAVLLAQGAEPDARDREGNTPLHLAAQRGSLAMIWLLLDYDARVDLPNHWGETPLHRAAAGGATALPLLLQRGARVDVRDLAQRTPLHEAAVAGDLDALTVLLAHGAERDACDAEGRSARALAAAAGQAAAALLLEGCSPRGVSPRGWQRVLRCQPEPRRGADAVVRRLRARRGGRPAYRPSVATAATRGRRRSVCRPAPARRP